MNQTINTTAEAVIVLGVYGSGSSAVAGILHHLGVMMGETLIPATTANPKGHFEDAEFRRLLYQRRQDPSKLAQIEAFIQARFADYPLWGVKEPAILEVISDIAPLLQGRQCKIIATQRDVDACVRSFQRKWPGCDVDATRQQIQLLLQKREEYIKNWSPEVLWIDFNELTDKPEQHVRAMVQFVFGDMPSIFGERPWPSAAAIQSAIDSIDPDMNHRLERQVPQTRRSAPIPYHLDPLLQKWVNPRYLQPDCIARIREASKAKPFSKYAVLDDFFNEDVLDVYIAQHQALEFSIDDAGRPYDSSWAKATEDSLGAELFYYEPWQRLLAEYTDTELVEVATSVKLRKHDPDSKGFWIHTDRTKHKSTVVLAALIYLNRRWREQDGALLQLWVDCERSTPISEEEVEYRWTEYKEQRLEFLNERYSLVTDLVTYDGIRPAELFLIDQILPEYNRLVITDFLRDPAYHSITPSNGRSRYAIVQWLM